MPLVAQPTSPWRRRVTLAAPLLGLVLCELGVRIAGLAPLPIPRQEGPNFVDVEDPLLRYVNRPQTELSIPFVDELGSPARIVRAHINADGFRGEPMPQERRPGVVRVACVGDSHTFGWGVNDDEPWPAVLGRRLGREQVEVLNAGVNGYDAEQEVLFCERHVLPWQPDLVVWQYFINDAGMRDMELRPDQEPGWLLRLTWPNRPGVMANLRHWWRTLDVVADRFYRSGAMDLYGDARNVLYSDSEEGWLRARAALLRARDACRAQDAQFVMLLFPYLHGTREALVGREAHAFVARFCAAEGIAVLDLDRLFTGRDLAALRVHPADYHANAVAHALAGEATADWLLAQGLLP